MANSRTNNATKGEINKDRTFGTGASKNVWEGVYTEGGRRGQRCVAKEFRKSGQEFKHDLFDKELEVVDKTQSIIDSFVQTGILGPGRHLRLNRPAIWHYELSRHLVLIEPMIEYFEKFNSNSGWTTPLKKNDKWSAAMQALSYFSYHDSDRGFLLCDLQGGAYADGFILTDPVIQSQTRSWSPADFGPGGIESFFERHHCGEFCKSNWLKPVKSGQPLLAVHQGTSMESPPLTTRQGRPRMSPLARLQEE